MVVQLVEALRYKLEGHGFDSWWHHWNLSLAIYLWPHYGPGVNSASNRHEYHIHVSTVLKSGSLNLFETSGPIEDCIEIAVPFN